MNKVIVLLALLICVAGATPFTQLVNALFSRSQLATTIQPKFESNGIAYTPGACSGEFPALADVQYVLRKGSLNFCYDVNIGYPFNNGTAGYEVEAVQGWSSLINSQYQLSVTVNFVNVNTEQLGLFPSLFAALSAGTCDGILSSIFRTDNRSTVAEPSCAYGSVLPGYARGTLEPSLNLSSVALLDVSGIRLGVLVGSIYQSFNTVFPSATFFYVTNFDDLYSINSNGTVHAILYDAPTLFDRAANAPQTLCGADTCRVYSFTPGFDMVVYSNLTVPATAKRALFIPALVSGSNTLIPIAFLIFFIAALF